MAIKPKDYLTYEGDRNRRNAALYTAMVKEAFGADNAVLIGHHISFEQNGDISTENEIPAADTLIFDPDIMRAVFGGAASAIMVELATLPIEYRDCVLANYFNNR